MDSDSTEGVIREKGTYFKIRYRLKTGEGEYVKGDPREGFAFLEAFSGYNQLLPGLEEGLLGRKEKDTVRLTLTPEEAFGPYRPELVKQKTYKEIPEGTSLQEGKWAVARDEGTRAAYGYFVKEKKEDRIVLDYNHPLAGKALIYDLEILEVRPATDEERSLLRPCEEEQEKV